MPGIPFKLYFQRDLRMKDEIFLISRRPREAYLVTCCELEIEWQGARCDRKGVEKGL
jgi:hypothetical protein